MDILYKIFIDPFMQMGAAPDLLVQTLWEGLVAGVLYSLIALGFVLIFKASGIFNFAQGIMVVYATRMVSDAFCVRAMSTAWVSATRACCERSTPTRMLVNIINLH